MHAYRDQYATLFKDGRNVVLLAVSADPADTLAAWAHDDEFPFLFGSDTNTAVGRMYGAFSAQYHVDNRTLFVIDQQGVIRTVMAPFREIDPTAYPALARAVDALLPKADSAAGGN